MNFISRKNILFFILALNTFLLSNSHALEIHTSEKSTAQQTKSFSRIFIFGDSLTDVGNLYSLFFKIFPKSPPYHEGRFSNGPIWIEVMQNRLSIPDEAVINYSFGGARVVQKLLPIPGLKRQVDKYLRANDNKADPQALYVVWMGANDMVFDLQSGQESDMEEIRDNLKKQIEKLINIGAKTFLIPNMPNLGMTPDAIAKDEKAGNNEYSQTLKTQAGVYNSNLTVIAQDLLNKFPDVTFLIFDAYKFMEKANENPSDYGIKFLKERCNPNGYTESSKDVCTNPNEYLFWDGVHPSSHSHEVLTLEMIKEFDLAGYTLARVRSLNESDLAISLKNTKAIQELVAETISQEDRNAIMNSFAF